MVRPTHISELCDAIREGGKIRLRGGGSKNQIGAPDNARIIDMRGFSGVVDYDPAELVLTVRPGTPLAEVEALVAREEQMLAFDPFDHGVLLGGEKGRATIGGVVIAGVSGPGRLTRGAARDHLLGFSAVSGSGTAFKAGGKVVKNVTGYDVSKVIAGSWGRLAAVTEMTLKVLPRPRTTRTIVRRGLDPHSAIAAMAQAMGSPAEVTAAAHIPDWNGVPITALRLDGFPASVAAREALLSDFEPFADGDGLWTAVREATPLAGRKTLWRIVVPAGNAPHLIAALPASEWLMDWAGGLVWLAGDHDATIIRRAAASAQGHAMLVRAAPDLRKQVATQHPRPSALAGLEARVRRSFDPSGVFETGRFADAN